MGVSPTGRMRIPILGMAGVSVVVLGTLLYVWEEGFMVFVTPERALYFQWVAEVYLLALAIGIVLVLLEVWRFVNDRVSAVKAQGFSPLSPGWLLPYVLSISRYRKVFAISAVLYGLFYALITSMIVYQPTVDFVQAYGASFPSALVTPCCGPPLFAPVVTVYLVNHLGLLVIPLTLVLLLSIALLVGLNFALSAFAFDGRARGGGTGWLGGVGALVGLFTGCPTCAGLFFANVIGGSGAVSFATLLAYYQPVFIVFSLPVLFVTPYLISRSLSKVYREGCVFIAQSPSTGVS